MRAGSILPPESYYRPVIERARPSDCTITRAAAGHGEFDPATGTYPPAAPDVLYTGPCRVQPLATDDRPAEVAGDLRTLLRYQVTIPMGPESIAIDDTVTITSGDPLAMVRPLRVLAVNVGDLQAIRNLTCQDDQG